VTAATIDPERSGRWRSEVVPPEVMVTEDIRAELGYDLDLYERAQHPVSKAGYARRIEALVKEMDRRVAT